MMNMTITMNMTPADRLRAAFEMSSFCKRLFFIGLRRTFPAMNEEELRRLYLKRLEKCHNRNY